MLQRVGCDLEIGSSLKVDECGVCGGDGSSCVQPLYHWSTAPVSLCSVSCGGGELKHCVLERIFKLQINNLCTRIFSNE